MSVVLSMCAVHMIVLLQLNLGNLNSILAFCFVLKVPPIVCHLVDKWLFFDICVTNGFRSIQEVVPVSKRHMIGMIF